MMKGIHSIGRAAVLSLALIAASSVQGQDDEEYSVSTVLPPEADNPWSAREVEILDNLALWKEPAGKGFRSRYRLTMSGINCVQYSFRIDESSSGRLRGRSGRQDKCRGSGKVEVSEFEVWRSEFGSLREAFRKANLWQHYPEFWVNESDAICVDGNELVFEKRDADGYGISIANNPCNVTAELLEVGMLYTEIFHADQAKRLLS